MQTASTTGDGLKAKINQLRARVLNVAGNRECDCPDLGQAGHACGGRAVAAQRFVVFPCSHAFRVACIEASACPSCGLKINR